MPSFIIRTAIGLTVASLRSYYHPSNHGKWSEKLGGFLDSLAYQWLSRVARGLSLSLFPCPSFRGLTRV
jgi:hypothetical protein